MINHEARSEPELRNALQALLRAEHADPFALLGPQQDAEGAVIRTFQPGARQVELMARPG